AGSPSAGLGCIAGVSKESTAVQSCWTWVKRAFILPIRRPRPLHPNRPRHGRGSRCPFPRPTP
ncbi:hypothetical protein, partial [Acinetobacter baumannii]|uniref:hypothetical protein n=1 Tax=Acinetobacter baumannii TaxID=470 RepID=UPI0031D3B371